jgi:hypothetical protein
MCPGCRHLVPLQGGTDGVLRCGRAECGLQLQKCSNYINHGICNRCVPVKDAARDLRCDYCRLTTVVPDLAIEGNREKWRRLERAKQRVLYILDLLGLSFRATSDERLPVLTFEFKADGDKPINIGEADDVERERRRVLFREPHRTLVGHFRHELGHFFWDRLIRDQRESEFREVFGDERDPTYGQALEAYHQVGPSADWQRSFVSAYASMHPWEDFAETFGAYLDMVTVLDTAAHFGIATCDLSDPEKLVRSYQRLGLLANEMNRDMGLVDLVPEVFVPSVVHKLRFVHSLTRGES